MQWEENYSRYVNIFPLEVSLTICSFFQSNFFQLIMIQNDQTTKFSRKRPTLFDIANKLILENMLKNRLAVKPLSKRSSPGSDKSLAMRSSRGSQLGSGEIAAASDHSVQDTPSKVRNSLHISKR